MERTINCLDVLGILMWMRCHRLNDAYHFTHVLEATTLCHGQVRNWVSSSNYIQHSSVVVTTKQRGTSSSPLCSFYSHCWDMEDRISQATFLQVTYETMGWWGGPWQLFLCFEPTIPMIGFHSCHSFFRSSHTYLVFDPPQTFHILTRLDVTKV